jgi:hypothetical protein
MAGTRQSQSSPKRLRKPRSGSAMPLILRGVPKGYDWGWFSREDPRMHLQVIDDEHKHLRYKVCLENRGRRTFQPDGTLPARVLKALRTRVDEERERIENLWTLLMVQSKWLAIALDGSLVTVTANPRFPGSRFTRTVDLEEHFPGIYDTSYPARPREEIRPEDVFIRRNPLAIGIWPSRADDEQAHISLPEILWQD